MNYPRLVGWNAGYGMYTVTFCVPDGKVYGYETYDKLAYDNVKKTAEFKPGKAFNLAKKIMKEVKKQENKK